MINEGFSKGSISSSPDISIGKSAEKLVSILRHSFEGDLLPALNIFSRHKEDLTVEQRYDLSRVYGVVERMEQIARQSSQLMASSQGRKDADEPDAELEELIRVENVLHALTYTSTAMKSDEFFCHCVETLAELFHCKYALISILNTDQKSVRTTAILADGRIVNNIEYDLKGTPCNDVVCLKKIMISEGVPEKYPQNQQLPDMSVESYFGAPLMTTDQGILGLVAVMDTETMQVNQWASSALSVFAARIASEVLRRRALDELEVLNAELEQKVVQRTRDIELRNRELKAFNYSVSHDLRAPVRTINSFMQIVFEDYGEELSEGARNELLRIQRAGHRLDDIINSLLNLARIGQQEICLREVNLSVLAERAMKGILQDEKQQNVELEIEPDLVAVGDESLLEIALGNLLENALKYSRNNSAIKIKLSAQLKNNEKIYCIQDNGVGFNMDYSGQLFQPFKRLHTEKEFPGTGIGLATVKRVFDSHNGRVWAESSPGNGASFYFTLPSGSELFSANSH